MSMLDEESYTGKPPSHIINRKSRLLFVCECNLNRSPAFEKYFLLNKTQYEVKSCGTSYGYPNRLTKEILEWADKIYIMDLEQEMAISRRFPEYLNKVEIIGVSDGTPNLCRIIEYWIKKERL